jgi:hypothetical protein
VNAVQFQTFPRKSIELTRRTGITLIEVLAAILIVGVGLLALLALFPLGALSMAQAVKDDRTAALASDAVAMSQAGVELVSDTGVYARDSLVAGSADPATATLLRANYEELGGRAADLESQLAELESLFQSPRLRLQWLASLARIKAIQAGAGRMVRLLQLLEGPNSPV